MGFAGGFVGGVAGRFAGGFAGANPPRFLGQFSDMGFKAVVLGNTAGNDEGILKLMGGEAVGAPSAGWYAATLDAPDNGYRGPLHGTADHRGDAERHRWP
jgi:hypothetical protein